MFCHRHNFVNDLSFVKHCTHLTDLPLHVKEQTENFSFDEDELVHLLERHHNDHFMQILDSVMPMWRSHRTELNRLPLAHEDWSDA